MKALKIFALAIGIAALLPACKQEAKKSDTPAATDITTPSAKPEIVLYATTVDKLNLREQSNRNAKVVAQFAEGDFVEGTGEASSNKEEVILRDIPYNEPYYKVVSTTPEQHTGWAYGAALRPVYAGPRANSPDLGKLVQFTTFLKSLDVKKIDSGKKAWNYVQTTFADANGSLADAAFILLEHFLRRMEFEGEFYTMTEKIQWTDEDYTAISSGKFDMKKYPASTTLDQNGFRLAMAEGMVFPVVDWTKLKAFFSPKVSSPMKEFVDQQTIEDSEQAWDDGGIVIELEKLADRAAFWEKFNREHPYFPLSEQAQHSESWLRLTMTNGADNTPVFDYESQTVVEEFKKVWVYIQQKYPGTKLAKATKEMADLTAAEGWKRTKKVEDLQAKFAEAANN